MLWLRIWIVLFNMTKLHVDGLVQERRNSIANVLELGFNLY